MRYIATKGANMQIKDYQLRALTRLEEYLESLAFHTHNKRQIVERLAGLDHLVQPYDVPAKAWQQITQKELTNPYKNGLGQDTPHICLKIPTGGGKTYLATRCVELIQRKYQHTQHGLVLWIVPTKAIYTQTHKALSNIHHPYRQTLDKASGGQTLIVEKDDFFSQSDVQHKVVVLLLMLQSGNRKLREEQLKLFKGRSGFMSFFPPEGNVSQHQNLYKTVPNLDIEGGDDQLFGVIVKPSLGNVIRLLQPLIILDESHRASTELAHDTLRDFNPSFVLELSATPKSDSNILVNISGQDLHQEEMIKLDLHVTSKNTVEWQIALLEGYQQIQSLQNDARDYQNNGGMYIRPIAVISVERTGKKQDNGEFIHVNNARDYLLHLGVSPEQIAIKTAEQDEINGIDLMSETCPIQYIITKDALKEGWDCAFAYVLVILQNTRSKESLTQLIGRILRQPYAKKTGIKSLDESYLFCYQRSPKDIIESISKGFRQEGLDDLTQKVQAENTTLNMRVMDIAYRPEFAEWTIYLPRFVVQEAEGFRPISYRMDVLPYIAWHKLTFDFEINLTFVRPQDERLSLTLGDSVFNPLKQYGYRNEKRNNDMIDRFYLMRQIADIVPNDWLARYIVDKVIDRLGASYSPETIANHPTFIAEQMRRFLIRQIDGYFGDEVNSIGLAGEAFLERVKNNEIVFFLEKREEFALPKFIKGYEGEKRLVRADNSYTQRSLFDPLPERVLSNELEKSVALYLDEQHNLLWWYKHLVGEKYYIQGWRNSRIYSDFVVTHRNANIDYNTVYVLETKGLHLKESDDTRYKKSIFDLCNELGHKVRWEDLGAEFKYQQVLFHVIYDIEWKNKINQLFV
jgi:type III restriction enzyme